MGKSQLTDWCDAKTGLGGNEQQLIDLLNQENKESDSVLQFQRDFMEWPDFCSF